MAKKIVRINLSEIENFHFAMQQASELTKERLQIVMEQWARSAQKEYDSLSGYGSSLKGKSSFYEIKSVNSGNGLYVAVGHKSYIARFLEVGTKAHSIPHKKGTKFYVVKVKDIKGTKALGRVWNKRRKEIKVALRNEVKNILKGGI